MNRKELIRRLVDRRVHYRRAAKRAKFYTTRLRAEGKVQLATRLLRELGARECKRLAATQVEG